MSHIQSESPAPLKAWWQRYGILPNSFTFARVLGCFVPMWMIFNPQTYWGTPWWLASIIVLVIVAGTDFVDGMLARLTDSITKFGEKFDPIADKLLVIPTFFAICWTGLIISPWSWIIFFLTVIPEVVLVTLNLYLMSQRVDARIPSIWPGKVKMWLQCVGLLLALVPMATMWWQGGVISIFSAGIILSYIAAQAYIRTGLAYLKPAQ